ncbi:FixH family protein [Pseudoxanthobacter sp. M-2]|uniref:FixH family protein n=1 Tax=Pseudoxanthobacter sp. M-2 TaxID=3078754 RepID=UPI0038FCFEE3
MPVALPIAAPPPAPRERRLTGRVVLASLVGFFLVVAGANAVMITVALTTFGGARTDSSYRAGQRYAAERAAMEAQDALGWTVDTSLMTTVSTADASAPERVITVTAVDADGLPLAGLVATVRLEHPADTRRDIVLDLVPAGAGAFSGTVNAAHGQWDLVVELARDGAPSFRSTRRIYAP